MKRTAGILLSLLTAAAMLTGCAGNSSGNEGSSPAAGESSTAAEPDKTGDGTLNVSAAEDFDQEYADLLRDYFTAIGNDDFEAYKKTVYPPYLESYAKFLEGKGETLESNFHKQLHDRFNEDGYDGWHFTELELSYYPEARVDLDGFFKAFISAGIFDEKFETECRENAEEIRDVEFSLYALYDGDKEDVNVAGGKEIMVLKTKDGSFLLG